MNELKKIYTKLCISVVLIFILIVCLFLSNKLIKNISVTNKYIYSGNINYSVIEKSSNVSDQKLFVTTLVDKINTNFNYKYVLDNSENLKYRYEIIASVVSNLDDSKEEITEVYKKDEKLLNTSYKTMNTDIIEINEQIYLDFNYYNAIAIEYDNSVNIPIKSKLILKLNLYVDINEKEEVYSSSLSMPLEKSTFSINTIQGTKEGTIYGDSKNYTKFYVNLILVVLITITLGFVIYTIYKFLKYKNKHILEFKYRKIMQDYDNVVVEIPEIPNDKNMTLIRVLYFKSMIDIQKELHVPILCYKNESYIVYLIISDKLAYVYFLNNNNERI